MSKQIGWKGLLIGGTAALALTAGAFWAVDQASAADATATWRAGITQQVMEFAGHGGRGGPDGGHGMGGLDMHGEGAFLGDQEQYLADALGITVEELQSAHETARNAMLDQAVADGTLTQEQADQIKAGEHVRVPGLKMRGGPGMDESVDQDAFLADALGITVDQLDAARTTARDAAIAAALADGTITQEQVDRMNAQQALHDYIRTTYADARPTAAMEDLIQEAVTAGALTQDQADLLLSGPGFMGPGGHDGFRGGRDGGMRGLNMQAPQSENGTIPDGTQQNRNDNSQENGTDSNA